MSKSATQKQTRVAKKKPVRFVSVETVKLRAAKAGRSVTLKAGTGTFKLRPGKVMTVKDSRGGMIHRDSATGRFATPKSARVIDRTVTKYADSLKRLAKR